MCLRAGLCCGSGSGHSCVPCWPRGSSRRCAHHCRWRHPELRAHREGPGSRGIHCDVWLHAGWHHRGTRCAALLAQHAQWLHQTDSAACPAAHLVHCLPPSNCTACTVTACKAAFVAAEPDKSRGVGHCHALRQPTKRCSGTGVSTAACCVLVLLAPLAGTERAACCGSKGGQVTAWWQVLAELHAP